MTTTTTPDKRTGYKIEKIPNNWTLTYYINGHCLGKAFYTKKECQDYAENLIKEGII